MVMAYGTRPLRLPTAEEALPGRAQSIRVPERHHVSGRPMLPPYPAGTEVALFGMGCFWGAERRFWQTEGVVVTAAVYAGGLTANPTYEEVCTGLTGHAEAVLVVYDPGQIPFDRLLGVFWEGHNPTQGFRQGNDVGTQYRSALYCTSDEQIEVAGASRDVYQAELHQAGYPDITTEIATAGPYYFAEDYHQQYLAKNPNGYCGLGGTGVACPTGLSTA